MNILFVSSDLIIDIIGYLGSGFVLFSFLLKDIKKIRIINIIGALFFVIFGFCTDTLPTAFMNLALIFVHVYYLVKMHLEEKKNNE
jgi:hypothetical protein